MARPQRITRARVDSSFPDSGSVVVGEAEAPRNRTRSQTRCVFSQSSRISLRMPFVVIGDGRFELKDSPIDLSRLESLVSIELRNNVYDHDQTHFSQRVAPILLSLPRPSKLVKVTLYCPGYEFATYRSPTSELQWKTVDDALALSDNPCLRQIHFKLGANIFPATPNLLPGASARGVVTRLSKMMRSV